MAPDDDPEDRIRQLEQPLADAARASELGGTPPAGYAPPPPLSPPPPPYGSYGYGGLYQGASPKSSGNRVLWIVAGFFVVGMLILICGVVAIVMHRVSHGGIIVESTTPSATQVSTSPRTTPGGTAPSIAIPTITEPQTSAPPPAAGPVTVTGVGQNRTIACKDNTVTVSGVSNTVTITGHCTSLSVSGVKNSITVDAVDSIVASGVENHVTYHSGSPQITKSGPSVVVQQG